jgi:hypothetical protein
MEKEGDIAAGQPEEGFGSENEGEDDSENPSSLSLSPRESDERSWFRGGRRRLG